MRGVTGFGAKSTRQGLMIVPVAFETGGGVGEVTAATAETADYIVSRKGAAVAGASPGQFTFALKHRHRALLGGQFTITMGTSTKTLVAEVVDADPSGNAPTVTIAAVEPVSVVNIAGAPIAGTVNEVAAALAGNNAGHALAINPATPATPRQVRGVFGAGWDGGDLTITGTDAITGETRTEVLTSPGAGGGTVNSVHGYSIITAASKAVQGGNAATVSLGSTNALSPGCYISDTGVKVTATNVLESAAAVSVAGGLVTPTTAPDAAELFSVIGNMKRPVNIPNTRVYGYLIFSSFGGRRA